MKTFTENLPFFPGFYESVFENSDGVCYEMEDYVDYHSNECGEDISIDDVDFDYKGYETAVSEAYVEVFNNLSPAFVENIVYKGITSPKYYNFSTDKVDAEITLVDTWREDMLKFLEDNKDFLSNQIKKDWTSYDGFMSFMSNDYDDWVKELSNDEPDERYLITIIGYAMVVEHGSADSLKDDLYMSTLEEVYMGEYVTYNPEEKENS